MKRKRKTGYGITVLFLLVLLLTVGMVALRFFKTEDAVPVPESKPPQQEMPAVTEQKSAEESPAPVTTTEEPVVPAPSADPSTPAPTESSAPAAETPKAKAYTEKSYQLASDLAYVCREVGLDESDGKIPKLLEELEKEDPALAKLWRGIVDELRSVTAEEGSPYTLQDDLPQDDSLCFAVLGFQLLYDGEMAPELLGRCETALKALQQYPQAYVAVTGGGTAFGNRKATEADVMAAWFREQGIASERIIVENSSLTTDQNAVNTCAILTKDYPQIKKIAVITSDYHMPLGRMMFTEAALLHAYQTDGDVPFSVSDGPAWATAGNDEYSGRRNIMSYVWIMAEKSFEKK